MRRVWAEGCGGLRLWIHEPVWRVTARVRGERCGGGVIVAGVWELVVKSEGGRVKGARVAIRFRKKRLCGGEGWLENNIGFIEEEEGGRKFLYRDVQRERCCWGLAYHTPGRGCRASGRSSSLLLASLGLSDTKIYAP